MIELRDINYTVAGRRILHIAHLQIAAGEKVAILGRNGAGKSTLLRMLNGFVQPTGGHIRIDGLPVFPLQSDNTLRQVRSQMGQVLQGLHLVPRLTALENTVVGGLSRMPLLRSWMRLFTQAEMEQAQAALQSVGMWHLAHKRADQLSGGERQKVAIARMLMQKPRWVLADEPTAALDPTAAEEVCRLLVQASQDATLITVVHNTALVPVLAQRVIGIKAGEIVIDCQAHELSPSVQGELYE